MPRGRKPKYDVPGCPTHETVDQHGNRLRTGPCTGFCRIAAELNGRLPLTQFLIKLLSYGDEDLMKANAGKAASVYGVSKEHAAGYIRLEIERRGLSGKGKSRGRVHNAPAKRKAVEHAD